MELAVSAWGISRNLSNCLPLKEDELRGGLFLGCYLMPDESGT